MSMSKVEMDKHDEICHNWFYKLTLIILYYSLNNYHRIRILLINLEEILFELRKELYKM